MTFCPGEGGGEGGHQIGRKVEEIAAKANRSI